MTIAIYPYAYLASDWRVVQEADRYVLEFCDPARLQWHERFCALTEQECRDAFEAFSEGETPVGNEVWS